MILKTNLHLHTADDPKDKIRYTTFEAIDKAGELDFEVLAVTCHDKFTHKKEHEDYAKEKGVLLISGIEKKIEGKDVVILNCKEDAELIKDFKALKNYKKNNEQTFILAPHPFVWSSRSLGRQLEKNIDLFDAIELTIFSTNKKIFNFNKKAVRIAQKYNKPIIATSDTHYLSYLKRGWALIDAKEKTTKELFKAIGNKKIKNQIVPMSIGDMVCYRAKSALRKIF